jgi:SpoVK/Ycf46/Vps4 family AAA+-type ATPase
MESLIEELAETGILQVVSNQPISDFKGEHKLLETLVNGAKPQIVEPNLGELPRIITEYCILPLGYEPVKILDEDGDEELVGPQLPAISTMMLFGPKGSGKTTIVNAIASETGSNVFNITPRNTAGQFLGKSNVTKMIHMVFKVAKAHAPSVIYIDNVELIFAKKIPKEDQTDPKRIKKDLLKQLKNLETSDRVMVIGSSSKPWDAEIKAILPLFEKFILCPKPDYPSRYTIWREFIIAKLPAGSTNELLKCVNASLLARLSGGMTAGQILMCCERAMTNRRLKLLKCRTLTSSEFCDQIINMLPLAADEDKLMMDWYEKTPLIRRRINALTAVVDDGGDKKKPAKAK